ncbi:hypothetical protein vseg_018143 [Gypsophila vaccaria]
MHWDMAPFDFDELEIIDEHQNKDDEVIVEDVIFRLLRLGASVQVYEIVDFQMCLYNSKLTDMKSVGFFLHGTINTLEVIRYEHY